MYVCVCNSISDHRVREAIRAGQRSVRELQSFLGFASCCGKCSPYMRALIDEHGLDTGSLRMEQETTNAR